MLFYPGLKVKDLMRSLVPPSRLSNGFPRLPEAGLKADPPPILVENSRCEKEQKGVIKKS